MTEFLKDTILYRSYTEDAGADALYEDYILCGVLIREVFSADPEDVKDGVTVVYFFPGTSRCRELSGRDCPMPCPKWGDLTVLHSGTPYERTLRVAEAGYFTGAPGLEHIRLKLR